MGRKPKTTGPRARDPGAFKSVLVRINADGWRALKMLAIEGDTTLNALAVEAFNDLLKKQDAMIPRTEFDQAKSTWLEKFDAAKTTWQTQFDSLKDTLKAEIGSLERSRSEGGGKELAMQKAQTQTNWSTGIVITVCLSVLSLAIALAALLTRVYMGKP